ncbi:hypothetical protein E9W_05404 [Moraxella catarrhalis CO72]|nr:hypothetical protein E9W_05404 [Moraxella catarrhalis CO72]
MIISNFGDNHTITIYQLQSFAGCQLAFFKFNNYRNNQSANAEFGLVIKAFEFSWQTLAFKICPSGVIKSKGSSRLGKIFMNFHIYPH